MDRTLEVRTPESIAFSYELAGVGSRFLAVAIDVALQLLVTILLIWAIVAAAGHAPVGTIRSRLGSGELAASVVYATVIAAIFAIFFGYFIAFEWLWHGQTPGKRILRIRVVRDGGYPVDFMASLIRNLIRVGEVSLGFYAVSVFVAVLSPQNKRIGDIAAGTVVVREARMESPEQMLREINEPVYAATAYVSGEERALIRRFLDRRTDLVIERRLVIARNLAERVRPRVPAELQRLDDEDLLERL